MRKTPHKTARSSMSSYGLHNNGRKKTVEAFVFPESHNREKHSFFGMCVSVCVWVKGHWVNIIIWAKKLFFGFVFKSTSNTEALIMYGYVYTKPHWGSVHGQNQQCVAQPSLVSQVGHFVVHRHCNVWLGKCICHYHTVFKSLNVKLFNLHLPYVV